MNPYLYAEPGSVSVIGHVPMAALALIVGIGRFLNEGRILATVLGNAVATIFIARGEGEFALERAKAVLDGKDVGPVTDADTPMAHASALK